MSITQDDVLKEFGTARCIRGDECTRFDCRAEKAMADEILTLRNRIAGWENPNAVALAHISMDIWKVLEVQPTFEETQELTRRIVARCQGHYD